MNPYQNDRIDQLVSSMRDSNASSDSILSFKSAQSFPDDNNISFKGSFKSRKNSNPEATATSKKRESWIRNILGL